MTETVSVLVADDDTIVRAGVRQLLEGEPDITVVGEAENGRQAIERTFDLQPDVVVMDVGMPDINGLEATRQIKASSPRVEVLVLTMHRSKEYFYEMLAAGASGYVLKGADTGDLVEAVRTVAAHQVFLQPRMIQELLHGYLESVRLDGGQDQGALTPREREILVLLAEGYGGGEIAEQLGISTSTVYTHRGNLMEKLGFSKRHELIRYARRQGLLPPA